MKSRPGRSTFRLQQYDYSQCGAYFVTICTYKGETIFGRIGDYDMELSEAGSIVESIWQSLPIRYPSIHVDAFVVMPNHIHGIIFIVENIVGAIHELPLHQSRIQRRRMLLPKVIGYLKMNSSKQINNMRGTPGKRVWQRNYYEHVIRNEEALFNFRRYILNNPNLWLEDPEYPTQLN
jgi:REP element-mobilizing transposase RayT